jgi:hypothetical protein
VPGQVIAGELEAVREVLAAYAEAGAAELLVTFRAATEVDEILRQMEAFAPLL